jgi:hypothetical protein
MRKAINGVIIFCGILLLVYAVVDLVLLIGYPDQSKLSFWNLRSSDSLLKNLAEIAAYAAIGFWVTKTAFLALKKQELQPAALIKPLFLQLQKHHVLIGWVVLLTTSAHGLYYILHKSDRNDMMVSGWIAWSGLIILAFIGVYFEKWLKERKKTKKIRLYHIGFSLVFLVGFVLHVF